MTTNPSYSLATLFSVAESISATEKVRWNIRNIISNASEKESAAFVLWDLIDQELAKAAADEKPSWIFFRKKFEDDLLKHYIQTLETVFANDPDEGWKVWTQTLVEAISFFRDSFCMRLSNHSFPFPTEKDKEVEAMRKTVKLIRHGRWSDVYNHIQSLSELSFIPPDNRVKLILMLGEIQLYHFAEPEKAKEFFEKAKKTNPLSERVAYCFGEYCLEKNDLKSAEAYFNQATQINPLWQWSRKKTGEVFEAKEELEKAEKWYQDIYAYENLITLYGHPDMFAQRHTLIPSLVAQAIEINPENEYLIYTAAGDSYEQNNKFEQALSWYDKAIDLDKTQLQGYISKGYCMISRQDCQEEQNKEYGEAEKEFEQAIKQAPEAFDGYWGLSVVYEKLKRWDDTLHFLEESKKRRPASAITILVKKSEVLWKKGEYDKATTELTKLLAANPASQDVVNQLEIFAEDYSRVHDNPEAAIDIYDDILRISGDGYQADYYNRRGNIHYYYERYNEALLDYQKAVAKNPEKAIFHRNIAAANKKLKRWEEAAAAIETVKKFDNDQLSYNREMSLVFNDEGNELFANEDFHGAIDKFKTATSYNPDDDVIFSNLARSWEKVNDSANTDTNEALEESINAYKKACGLRADPEYAKAIDRLTQKKEFIKNWGEAAAARTLTVSPIVMEVATDLISYFEGTVLGTMSPELATQVTDLRSRIVEEFGITVPRLLFRGNEYFTKGTYLIMLDEVPLVVGAINTEERFVTATDAALGLLGIKGRATTDIKGSWLTKEDWQKAKEKGMDVWEIVQYPVRHLELIVRNNLAEFTGHQEIADMIQKENPEAYNELKKSPQKLSALVAVCKALVNELAPLTPFKKVYQIFNEQYRPGQSLLPIVEAIRLAPEIRSKLPGLREHSTKFQLGTEFQKEIEYSLYKKAGNVILAMSPNNCQEALSSVRNGVMQSATSILIADNAALRPFVRKLVEIEFPDLHVLSANELLSSEKNISDGKIELVERAIPHHPIRTNNESDEKINGHYAKEKRMKNVAVYDKEEQTSIKVFVSDGEVQKTGTDDRDSNTWFKSMQDDLFFELGILLPPIQPITNADIAAGEFRLQINNSEIVSYKGLLPDEFVVSETVERLAFLGIKAQAFTNPVDGKANSLLKNEGDNLQRCKDLGLTFLDPGGFIILRVAAEIRKAAPVFQTLKSTRYSLSVLETNYPQLLSAISASFSEEQICTILKILLEDEISIRNLKAILEALLSVQGITDVDLSDNIVFSSLAENLAFVSGSKSVSQLEPRDYANVARILLKRYITYKYSPVGTMMAYLLEPKIEDRLKQTTENPLTEKEEEELKNLIVKEIKSASPTLQHPVILTTLLEKRNELQQIIKAGLPYIPVLNFQELSSNANIQVVTRILWQEEEAEVK